MSATANTTPAALSLESVAVGVPSATTSASNELRNYESATNNSGTNNSANSDANQNARGSEKPFLRVILVNDPHNDPSNGFSDEIQRRQVQKAEEDGTWLTEKRVRKVLPCGRLFTVETFDCSATQTASLSDVSAGAVLDDLVSTDAPATANPENQLVALVMQSTLLDFRRGNNNGNNTTAATSTVESKQKFVYRLQKFLRSREFRSKNEVTKVITFGPVARFKEVRRVAENLVGLPAENYTENHESTMPAPAGQAESDAAPPADAAISTNANRHNTNSIIPTSTTIRISPVQWPPRKYDSCSMFRFHAHEGGITLADEIARVLFSCDVFQRPFAWYMALNRNETKTAIVFEDEELSYVGLFNRANEMATVLRDEYGVGYGTKVAILLPKSLDWVRGDYLFGFNCISQCCILLV
jgi:hypothetical protein